MSQLFLVGHYARRLGVLLRRILLITTRRGLGDLVWHVDYFRLFKGGLDSRNSLTVLAPSTSRALDLLGSDPDFDAIWEIDQPRHGRNKLLVFRKWFELVRLAKRIRSAQFDEAYLFSTSVQLAWLCWFVGIPARFGFGFRAMQRVVLSPPFITRYRGKGNWVFPEATEFMRALRRLEKPRPPRLRTIDSQQANRFLQARGLRRKFVCIAIGASTPTRQWPANLVREFAHHCLVHGFDVVLVGGPTDRGGCDEILGGLVATGFHERVHALVGEPLVGLMAVLQNADLCVANDSGPLQISLALETPSCGLFGASPVLTHDPQLIAVVGDGMANIQPSVVWSRVKNFLGTPSA